MKHLKYFFFIVLLINSCSKKYEATIPGQVIIAGHILNYKETSNHNFVNILYFDIIEHRIEITQNIDDSGNFKITIDNLYRPKHIWLGYGQLLSFYINPGDSLHFEIDSKSLETYKGTGNHYSYYKVTGSSEKINNEIAFFRTVLEDSSFNVDYWDERRSAPKNLSPNEYLAFTETDLKKREFVAKNFISDHDPSNEFKEWVEYDLKFSRWEDLMRYLWIHPLENQLDRFEFLANMPKSYFEFLDTWNKENKDYLKSIAYQEFLQEYYKYKNASFDSEKFNKVVMEKGLNYQKDFDEITSLLYPGENGLILDILMAKRFSDSLEGKFEDVKDFVQIDKIKDLEIREVLTLKYKHAEHLSMINSSNQINEEITENFINELIGKHPNKILYIDFWATWCSPCTAELPYSNQIKEIFEGNDVVFVYLANRCGETVWKKTIKERDIKGDHYLLTDAQFSNMSKTFDISGIPHYVLIDKNGNIISKNAPRPSSGDVIINSINELL